MFTLRFTDSELQKQIENPHKFYAEEICNELQPYLDGLIQDGEIAGSDFYSGRINRIKGHTFQGFRTRIGERKSDNLGKCRRQDGAEIIMVE
jgi:hypothetical protein